MSKDPFGEQNRQIEELMRVIQEPQVWVAERTKPLLGKCVTTGQTLELNRETGKWESAGLAEMDQSFSVVADRIIEQANIIASHEAANEEMDAEKDLMRVFLEDAEREFRRCKQEPAFANWAFRFGLKIIQAARGELKWQVSTE